MGSLTVIHRPEPDCLTWKPHSGEPRNRPCSQNNGPGSAPGAVQRNQDVRQSVLTARASTEVPSGHTALRARLPRPYGMRVLGRSRDRDSTSRRAGGLGGRVRAVLVSWGCPNEWPQGVL